MHEHSQIIDLCGGTTTVAEACGVPPQYVSKWRRRGIPASYFPAVIKAAKAKRKKVTYDDLHNSKGNAA